MTSWVRVVVATGGGALVIVVASCGSDADPPPATPATPATPAVPTSDAGAAPSDAPSGDAAGPIALSPFCKALGAARALCNATFTDCEKASCEALAKLYSDGYKNGFIDCHAGETTCSLVRDGGALNDKDECVIEKVGDSTPTAAQKIVASHYCKNCPSSADASAQCEAEFFGLPDGGSRKLVSLGVLVASDDLAAKIDAQCTSSAALTEQGQGCELAFNNCQVALQKTLYPAACP